MKRKKIRKLKGRRDPAVKVADRKNIKASRNPRSLFRVLRYHGRSFGRYQEPR